MDTQPQARMARALLALAGAPLQRWLVARFAVAPAEPVRTACDRCDAALALTGAGWAALLPAGRCGRCGQRVGAPPYVLELLTMTAAVIVVLAAPTVPVLLAGLWWVGCAVPLVFIDLRVHRLPDLLTYPAAIGTLALLLLDGMVAGRWDAVIRSATAAGICGALFLLVALLLGNRGLGLGDAKLVVSIAILLGWWGWGAVFAAVFVGFLAAGLAGAALLAAGRMRRQQHLPMGPFLVAGALAVLSLLAVAPHTS